VIVNNQQDFVYNVGKGATDEASRLTFDQSWEQSGLFDIEQDYPRDLIGYGRDRPRPVWPREARVAVQFVISYEEGGENCVLHGDAASEAFLSEIVGAQPWSGQRHVNMESIYEYGSRVGFWRLWRMFTERNMPVTVYGVASAMARNPQAVAAMNEAGWEIASHGLNGSTIVIIRTKVRIEFSYAAQRPSCSDTTPNSSPGSRPRYSSRRNLSRPGASVEGHASEALGAADSAPLVPLSPHCI